MTQARLAAAKTAASGAYPAAITSVPKPIANGTAKISATGLTRTAQNAATQAAQCATNFIPAPHPKPSGGQSGAGRVKLSLRYIKLPKLA